MVRSGLAMIAVGISITISDKNKSWECLFSVADLWKRYLTFFERNIME